MATISCSEGQARGGLGCGAAQQQQRPGSSGGGGRQPRSLARSPPTRPPAPTPHPIPHTHAQAEYLFGKLGTQGRLAGAVLRVRACEFTSTGVHESVIIRAADVGKSAFQGCCE